MKKKLLSLITLLASVSIVFKLTVKVDERIQCFYSLIWYSPFFFFWFTNLFCFISFFPSCWPFSFTSSSICLIQCISFTLKKEGENNIRAKMKSDENNQRYRISIVTFMFKVERRFKFIFEFCSLLQWNHSFFSVILHSKLVIWIENYVLSNSGDIFLSHFNGII